MKYANINAQSLFSFYLCIFAPDSLVCLLQFGDRDGIGSEVLLQHPLGVYCAKNGQIYIADSYNHKVTRLWIR